jgi:hypothetical protein
MNFPHRLKHSKSGLHFLRLIFSLLLFVNLSPAHAQAPASETLNTNEAKSNREMGLAMLGEMKKVLEEY